MVMSLQIVLYVDFECVCPFGVGLGPDKTRIEWRLTIGEALEVCRELIAEEHDIHPGSVATHQAWLGAYQGSAA